MLANTASSSGWHRYCFLEGTVGGGGVGTAMSFFSFSKAISHFCNVLRGHLVLGSVRMFNRLFILLRSFFLSSFLSILLIILRSGSMYLESCFSLSIYSWSSDWDTLKGLITELGLPGVLSGPGEGTCSGVRAVAGLCEGCGEGLGWKPPGDGVGPELTELSCNEMDCGEG